MKNFLNISGQRFGRLIAVEISLPASHGKKALWKCICDCGAEAIVCGGKLRAGRTKSCGCLRREIAAEGMRTHGETVKTWSAEYRAWASMKGRCSDKYTNREDYRNYYGRGIRICERWLNSFQNFLDDVGRRPTKYHSLDRINNDGNYEPGNVRWATRREQALNKRTSLANRVTA